MRSKFRIFKVKNFYKSQFSKTKIDGKSFWSCLFVTSTAAVEEALKFAKHRRSGNSIFQKSVMHNIDKNLSNIIL